MSDASRRASFKSLICQQRHKHKRPVKLVSKLIHLRGGCRLQYKTQQIETFALDAIAADKAYFCWNVKCKTSWSVRGIRWLSYFRLHCAIEHWRHLNSTAGHDCLLSSGAEPRSIDRNISAKQRFWESNGETRQSTCTCISTTQTSKPNTFELRHSCHRTYNKT